MAYLEPNTVLASSQKGLLTFNNLHYYERPFVDIVVSSFGDDKEIIFYDRDDEENAIISIEGGVGRVNSASTFNTDGSILSTLLCLIESLRENTPYLYDITRLSDTSVRVWLDQSYNWNIIATNLTLYDGYSQASNKVYNKLNLDVIDGADVYPLQKYISSNTATFDVCGVFGGLSRYNAMVIDLFAYNVDNSVAETLFINNNRLTILPTTLSEFDSVDFYAYLLTSNSKDNTIKCLSGRYDITKERWNTWAYDEVLSLSVLTEDTYSDFFPVIECYTLNGDSLGECSFTINTIYASNHRTDVFFTPDISAIEEKTNKYVGYFDVSLTRSGYPKTKPIRFGVHNTCNPSQTIYFINRIGGVDSFSFDYDTERETSLSTTSTFRRNNLTQINQLNELLDVGVAKEKINDRVTLTSTRISQETAKYLQDHLQPSKYIFTLQNEQRMVIIPSTLSIDILQSQSQYSATITYTRTDRLEQ